MVDVPTLLSIIYKNSNWKYFVKTNIFLTKLLSIVISSGISSSAAIFLSEIDFAAFNHVASMPAHKHACHTNPLVLVCHQFLFSSSSIIFGSLLNVHFSIILFKSYKLIIKCICALYEKKKEVAY